MGINIRPEERDETNLTRLTIDYKASKVETPNRFVNRNDINAKNRIGANIPLTRMRNIFVYEESINKNVVENIINKNGYLAEFRNKIDKFFSRIEDNRCLKAVFPKLPDDIRKEIKNNPDSKISIEIKNFLLDLSQELKSELYIFNSEILDNNFTDFLNRNDITYAPVFKIKEDKNIKRDFGKWRSANSLVPFIGFTYSSYAKASLSYKYIISQLDKVHEANKGIIMVDIPRTPNLEPYKDISGPHYSSFLISDISTEIYLSGHGSSNKNNARIFEKDSLTVPIIGKNYNTNQHRGEDSMFNPDNSLKDLFWRTLKGQNTNIDMDKNRPGYLSRVHESYMTTLEYEEMRKSLINKDLKDYRNSKIELTNLLKSQKVLDNFSF